MLSVKKNGIIIHNINLRNNMAQENYIEQSIITTLGLENLPLDEKAVIINKLSELVQHRLIGRVLTQLEDKMLEQFSEIVESNDSNAINVFFEKHVPNFPDMVIEETIRVKKEMAEMRGELDV